jgi:type VI secretion system protein ImpC
LAGQLLKDTVVISDDVMSTIQALIAEIDAKLTEQINHILHHADFQQMEGAWRGLNYLISNTETDEMLKIRVQNISKKELGKELKKYKGTAWDQSPIFKQIYEQEYGQFGGEPYGCLVGDFYFDHSPQDVELLSNMAQISAASHCPFISAADSSVMQMDSWQELSNP